MKIYGDKTSGNCYKIILTAQLLNLKYQWVHIDILKQETKSKSFLAVNPDGKIPILQLADGRTLSESNAIINFLATDSSLLPKNAFDLAKVNQWQFFEQYSHEPNVAVARFIKKYLNMPKKLEKKYYSCMKKGYQALDILEAQLQKTKFLTGNQFNCADITLYPYTKVADEAGFDLTQYQAICNWFEAVESQKKFIGIYET